MSTFPWLTVTGALPLAGAVVISLIPGTSAPGAAVGRNSGQESAAVGSNSGQESGADRKARDTLAKWLALGFSLATLVITIVIAVRFNPSGPDFQFTQTYSWIPAFGVHYAVGVDGIALVLIGLTAVLMPVIVLASWNDADGDRVSEESRPRRSVKSYFALLLLLETMIIGVFAATDVF